MNKQLSIIRHAKSDWSTDNKDFERVLNDRGYADAQLMGEYLQASKQQFDRVYCSTAKRAKLTLQQLNCSLKLPQSRIYYEQSLYLSSVIHLVSFIGQFNEQDNHIALIAHNPGLTDLCNFLTGDQLSNLPTCAVYSVQFFVDEWRAVGAECGTKKTLIRPRMLKEGGPG
tara:strand:- start:987 stop:1496 length:510 start_codon:yes stop_codon:yes gene_type:complete